MIGIKVKEREAVAPPTPSPSDIQSLQVRENSPEGEPKTEGENKAANDAMSVNATEETAS